MKNHSTPTKLRSGDEVIVIAGKDIGKKGTLREILSVNFKKISVLAGRTFEYCGINNTSSKVRASLIVTI